MNESEFRILKEDINRHGLIEPIWVYQDAIIDGRNRYNSCIELGITPKYRNWQGENPLDFIISLNLKRRHLNESQRAMIAAKLANIPKHIHKTDTQICVSQPEAAKKLNVSSRSVQRLCGVLEKS